MTKLREVLLAANLADRVLTDTDLDNLLDGTPASRYGLVNKAIKERELIRIRRGLYLLAPGYRHKKISKFYLANRIVASSYISQESALSYYRWIPEGITTVMSMVADARKRKFATPFGEFTYYQLPVNEGEFLTGVVRREEIAGEPFFIALPLRALADYVYIKKIRWQGMDYLTNGLRIDAERLFEISSDEFDELMKVYRSERVLHFLHKLRKEVKNNGGHY